MYVSFILIVKIIKLVSGRNINIDFSKYMVLSYFGYSDILLFSVLIF
jgi:hypothetical protein